MQEPSPNPCPVCGHAQIVTVPFFYTGHAVECRCGVIVPFPAESTAEAAVRKWNEYVEMIA